MFKPAAAAAGVEADPYDGRASYASLRIHAGESPRAVAAALGHASAETTWRHYAGLFEESRLASKVDPEEAIWTARRAAATGSGLRPGCDERRRGHLRLVS
ncbi:MAG: hypothetical protein AB7O78_18675 [Thermoleophilia bacterium]